MGTGLISWVFFGVAIILVLLSVVGTVGNTAIFKDYIQYETSLPRNIAYIITNEKLILPEYLTCFFMSYFSKIQTYSSSGGNNQGLISLTKLSFKQSLIKSGFFFLISLNSGKYLPACLINQIGV